MTEKQSQPSLTLNTSGVFKGTLGSLTVTFEADSGLTAVAQAEWVQFLT